jgi:7-cyano-7-deazaguanine synthase
MCGICSVWLKESTIGREQWDILLQGVSTRGQDGIGIGIHSSSRLFYSERKFIGKYEENKEEILTFLEENTYRDSLVMFSSRATPETEKETTIGMIQPIQSNNKNLTLIHNGGVTDSLRKELELYDFTSQVDSELILAAYEHFERDLKKTMEWLVGSFAFVLLDKEKEKLYAVTSFNPLAHMYIRGYGYFLHSDNSVLEKVLKSLTGQTQDGVNVWESWYHHYLEGYTIIETDLQSGFQFKTSYTPRFLHPVWEPKKTIRTKTLVVASGGLDSGLTAQVLKTVGHDVELIHFLYGQKSEDCELWAVASLAKTLQIPYRVIDLKSFYQSLPEKGMLTSKDVDISSGGDLIKSTIAWTSGRNSIFASMTMAIAESLITSNLYDYVYISAGWSQLSEETGGYPDNSFKFNECLEQLKMYGYITGSRINFLPVMQRLTKTEEWLLGSKLEFDFRNTVSCDNPKLNNNIPQLCIDCGSTKLSILASDRAGVSDTRCFDKPRQKLSEIMKTPPITDIIDRLVLTEDEKKILKIKCIK